jgi:hypothetical protein
LTDIEKFKKMAEEFLSFPDEEKIKILKCMYDLEKNTEVKEKINALIEGIRSTQ